MDKALKFLNGDEKEIINNLEDKMKKAAAELEFEQAAEYRDLIENVKRIGENKRLMIPVGMTETLSHLLKQETKRLWQYFLSEAESSLAGIISI